MTQPGKPVVFIHGLWLHASSWGSWLELFQEAGYAPTAPGWPGDPDTVEESRRDPSQVTSWEAIQQRILGRTLSGE